jgi:hypothetical protein
MVYRKVRTWPKARVFISLTARTPSATEVATMYSTFAGRRVSSRIRKRFPSQITDAKSGLAAGDLTAV